MGVTSDASDPRLTRGFDDVRTPQAEVYLVLSPEEIGKGFVRPVRTSYMHMVCSRITRMGLAIAETYARDPSFYGATYCSYCGLHRPVGVNGEFLWVENGECIDSLVGL
jgi:hypothetical protein